MLQNVVLVSLGGALGALTRFGVYELIARGAPHRHGAHGPGATVLVNIIGCLVLGLVLGWISVRGPLDERLRVFVTVGLLGAFTTFSTYAGDGMKLIQDDKPLQAVGYLFGSMALGLVMCMVGYALGAWATPNAATT